MRRPPLATLLLLSVACSSSPPPASRDRCPDSQARLAAAEADRADGHLFRALAAARAAAACAPRAAARLEAQALADLGVDADAIAAWRRAAAAPGAGAADRAEAAAAIAELGKRPPPERAATPDEQATALALYRDGVNLRLQKDYPGALRQLRRAYALWPHPLTIVQIAAIHRAAGDERAARRATERALAIAEATRKTPAFPHIASGNGGGVSHLIAAGDGRRLFTVDGIGKLRTWDAASGRQGTVIDLRGADPDPRDRINGVDIDRDGTTAVTVSVSGRVGIWALDSGRLLRELPFDDAVRSISMVAGRRIAVGNEDSIRLEPLGGGAPVQLAGPPDGLRTLAHDASGQVLAALELDNAVRVWRLDAPGAPVVVPLPGRARDLAMSFDGERIAVVIDPHIHTIDWRAGRILHTVETPDRVRGIAFGVTGLLAASVGNGHLMAWDGARPLADIDAHLHDGSGFDWSADGSQLITGADDWSLQFYEVATGRRVRSLASLAAVPTRIAVSPDDHILAVADATGAVTLRELRTGAVARVLRAHTTMVLGLGFSADGRRLATGSVELPGIRGQLAVWDPASGAELARTNAEVETLCLSRDGGRVYTGATPLTTSGEPGVWEVTADAVTRLQPESEALHDFAAIACSPGDDRVAAGGNDEIVILPSRGPLPAPRHLERHTRGEIRVLAFSADGGRLAAATDDGLIHLWDMGADLGAARFDRELPSAGTFPVAMAFAPDGRHLAVTYFDGGLGLYDLATGSHRTVRAHESVPLGVQFTRTGLLITAGQDATVRFWDPATGKPLLTLVTGSDGRWLVMTPDGHVNGSPGPNGGASLLYWQIGDVQLPGYVAWDRQHTPGLLRTVLSRATP